MRNIFLLCLVFFSFSLFSQSSFKLGTYFGPNLGQITGDGSVGYNKPGGQFGLFVSRAFKDNWDYKIALGYTNKGSFRPSKPDQGIFDRYFIMLQYIESRLEFSRQISALYIDGGAYVGVKLAEYEADQFGRVLNSGYDFLPVDVGIFFGLSYGINEKWNIGITNDRSFYTMANTIKVTQWGVFGGAYNNVLVINLDYTIR